MRLGLASDVHGNLVALEAVVADGRRNDVDAWWVLGDLVATGPDPDTTLELLTELPNVRFVRGNTDRYVVSRERPAPHAADVERDPSLLPLFLAIEASFSWTREQVGAEGLEWLSALPTTQRLALADGTTLLGVHASPRSDDGAGITPDLADGDLATLLGGADADVVCGDRATLRPTTSRASNAVNRSATRPNDRGHLVSPAEHRKQMRPGGPARRGGRPPAPRAGGSRRR
jgi:hypothetical protein